MPEYAHPYGKASFIISKCSAKPEHNTRIPVLMNQILDWQPFCSHCAKPDFEVGFLGGAPKYERPEVRTEEIPLHTADWNPQTRTLTIKPSQKFLGDSTDQQVAWQLHIRGERLAQLDDLRWSKKPSAVKTYGVRQANSATKATDAPKAPKTPAVKTNLYVQREWAWIQANLPVEAQQGAHLSDVAQAARSAGAEVDKALEAYNQAFSAMTEALKPKPLTKSDLVSAAELARAKAASMARVLEAGTCYRTDCDQDWNLRSKSCAAGHALDQIDTYLSELGQGAQSA